MSPHKQEFLQLETETPDFLGDWLDAQVVGPNASVSNFHQHADLHWHTLAQPLNDWIVVPNREPQWGMTQDGFVYMRGAIDGRQTDGSANFFTPLLQFGNIEGTDTNLNAVAQVHSPMAAFTANTGLWNSTMTRLFGNQWFYGTFAVPEAISIYPLDSIGPYRPIDPCLTMIFNVGHSYAVSQDEPIFAVSGLSVEQRTIPSAFSGQITTDVLFVMDDYIEEIRQFHGPLMIILTLGSIDEQLGSVPAAVAINLDSIVDQFFAVRDDVTLLHLGTNFSLTDNYAPLMVAPSKYPDRYVFYSLRHLEQSAPFLPDSGDNETPTAAGYLTRIQDAYGVNPDANAGAGAALTPPRADFPQTKATSCP